MGDLLTLTGQHFTAGESQVTVNFGSIPVTATPDSDTQISVTVPQGATDGPVSVTTTAMVNGQPLVQTSNPEDILVIWKDFDLTPILASFSDGFDGLWPGSSDDLYVKMGSYWPGGGPPVLIHVKADGSWDWTPDYDDWVMNPVNNTWAYFTDTYDTTCLEYPAGHQSVCTCRASEDCWVLGGEAAFDGAGNIYVDAETTGDLLGIWRFGPGEPIVLDPNSANCLTPGGVPVLFGSWDLTVAADGTVYFLPALSQNQSCGEPVQSLMKIPAGGGAYQIFPLPSIPDCDDSAWMLVTNCMGHSFAFNYGYAVTDPNSPQYLFSVPDNTPIATLGGSNFQIRDYYPITTDGYGDFYYAGRDTSTGQMLIRRVLPSELPPGFYDNFTCCPTDVQYKDVVQKSQGEQVDLQCPTQGQLKVKIFPDPGDPDLGDTGGSPSTSSWIDGSHSSSLVTFGQTPRLEAYWDDGVQGHTPTAEQVKWDLVQNSETAPNSNSKGLYYGKPEVLFMGNVPPGQDYQATNLRFQTVHTGQFQLTITTTNPQHQGSNKQPATLTFTIVINTPSRLGSGDPEKFAAKNPQASPDALIIQYADKYGVPPQYIKAISYHETSGTFNPNTYRYELYSVDKKHVFGWDNAKWQAHDYDLYRFTFPRTDGMTDADLAPRDTYSQITNLDFTQSFPYSCANFTPTTEAPPPDGDGAPVTLYEIYAGDDGWYPGSWPNVYYGVKGPCGQQRMNWMKTAGIYMAWHLGQFYCGPTQTVCTGGIEGTTATWLQNHATYQAQTAIAASYGLMQVLYRTAVEDLQWNSGQPGTSRHPAALFVVPTNLDLGSHFVAQLGRRKGFDDLKFGSFLGWHYLWSIIVQAYNSAQPYTTAVCSDAWSFRSNPD